MVMCVRRRLWALFPPLLATWLGALGAKAQLIEGIERWADATVGLSTTKWRGPRVPVPVTRPRPEAGEYLESLEWPIRVYAPAALAVEARTARRVRAVLDAAEATYALLYATGLLESFGDGGQSGSGARDLYLVEGEHGADAALDATGNFTALDGARAYALVDVRVPSDRLFACTAQALLEAQLYELDPAEAESLRRSSAAYFAYLITGDLGCDGDPAPISERNPFTSDESASGAAWLVRLGARQDRNRGVFLEEMWQLARQRTWEGVDLRASPDLLEAIAKVLELRHESFGSVAAELGDGAAAAGASTLRELSSATLPAFLSPLGPPLQPLGSEHVLLRFDRPRAGARLRVWLKGQPGVRYVLAATRLAADAHPLARLDQESRKDAACQLSVELDADTRALLLSVTRVDGGIPDPDTFAEAEPRYAGLTIDLKE